MNIMRHNKKTLIADILSNDVGVGYVYFDSRGVMSRVSETFKTIGGFHGDILKPGMTLSELTELSLKMSKLPETVTAKIGAERKEKYDTYSPKGIDHKEEEIFLLGGGRYVRTIHHYLENGGLLIATEDVTEQEKSRLLFKMGLELGSSGFWSLNFETGKYQFSEYISERLTEKEIERIHRKGLFAIIHPDDLPGIMDIWGKSLATGDKIEFTFRVVLEKHGELYLRNVGATQIDQNGKKVGFTAFVTDITDDIKTQRELEAATEASEAKSRFLAQMSHEIKTPLNAIIGMSDAMLDDVLPADAKESLKYILNSAEGLDSLLTNTLDHARMSSQKDQVDREDVNIAEILRNMTRSWDAKAKENNVKLTLKLSKSLPEVVSLDLNRTKQTLHNLISNAIKFTAGGEVIIGATLKDNSVCLIVKDNGIGMDEASLSTLFAPFVQGDNTIKRRFGGTGLGMSIVKQLVEVMDGEIKVQSVAGKGTAFVVSLPVDGHAAGLKVTEVEPPVASTEIEAEPLAQSVEAFVPPVQQVTVTAGKLPFDAENLFSGLRVLCVEDNDINQVLVKKLLEKSIGSLTFANNGQEALDILHTQAFDVILMDIHMPIKDGIETTIAIRNSDRDWADVIIIALTADPDYQQLRICRNIGMDGTLGKPVKRREIMKVIEDVLLSSDDKLQNEVAA